jgi:hypothetical protein
VFEGGDRQEMLKLSWDEVPGNMERAVRGGLEWRQAGW